MKLEKAQQLVKDYEEEYLSNHPMFTDDDMETLIWMVEQAARVQELERANKQLKNNLKIVKSYYKSLVTINEKVVDENKRYREALDRIVSETDHGSEGLDAETDLYHALEIAWKALEREEG